MAARKPEEADGKVLEEPADEESIEEGKSEESAEKEDTRKKAEKKKDSRRNIVRVGGKDLDGEYLLRRALVDVRGVSFTLVNAISKVSGLGDKKVGELKEDELKKIEDILKNPGNYGIPSWMFNRRFGPDDGNDSHLVSAQLELRQKMDINELKKRKNYRGVRHIQGLPVRGQRTRSSFRKSSAVGVSRVKNKPGEAKKK